MAKEEDLLKKVDLKASVNCCEGCKKKVLKALSIKGVMRTDIHPALPKVTVVGSVDAQTLIKKLAKVGKTAEVWPAADAKKQEKEQEKRYEGGEKEVAGGKEKAKDDDVGRRSNDSDDGNSYNNCNSRHSENSVKGDGNKGDKAAPRDAETGGGGGDSRNLVNPITTVTAALPQVNYIVNPSMVQGSGDAPTSYTRVYYAMEPYPQVPMTYYTTNAYPPPPPCCVRDHYCHELPVYHPPPPVQSLPPRLSDYFNDENTVGCIVM